MKNEECMERLEKILNDAHMYQLMHKVVDILMSYSTQDPNDFSRPYLRFIESAYMEVTTYYSEPVIFFLNGQPDELITPWGGWQCFDTDRSGKNLRRHKGKNRSERQIWDEVMPEITKRLGLQIIQSWEDRDDGVVLEWDQYALSEVDGESLSAYYGYYHAYRDLDYGYELFDMMRDSWNRHEINRNTSEE